MMKKAIVQNLYDWWKVHNCWLKENLNQRDGDADEEKEIKSKPISKNK